MSLGFYFNMQQCIGCRTCQVACKDRHNIHEPGVRARRVESFEAGEFPTASIYHTSISCNHCENPACTEACPTGAMYKSESGVVLHNAEECILCESCVRACPYEAPQHDMVADLIVKCDTCIDLRDNGMLPTCVAACPMRALDFGDVEELKAKYGAELVSELPCTETADVTSPNLLVNPLAASMNASFELVNL